MEFPLIIQMDFSATYCLIPGFVISFLIGAITSCGAGTGGEASPCPWGSTSSLSSSGRWWSAAGATSGC